MSTQTSSGGSNEGLGDSIEDLKLVEKGLQSATLHMEREGKYEDAVIFIGSTKSGKSSLINYFIGNKLIGESVAPLLPVSIKKADNSAGPQIGLGPSSETVFPTKWYSKNLPGLVMWDAPGFDDNRGIVQDITNAFFINQLFKNLKSAKIVLVTDISDVALHSIRPFLSLLNAVEKLFKQMGVCFNGIAIIFTKVQNGVSEKNIANLLEYQLFSKNKISISDSARNLIRHLITNKQKIGIFREAALDRVTVATTDDGIFKAILNASSINDKILKQVSPSITENSRLFLLEVHEELCSTKTFIALQNLIKSIYENNYKHCESIKTEKLSQNKLDQLSRELTISKDKLVKALDSTISLDEKIKILRMVDPSIAKLVDEHNLLHRAKFMEFVDGLLGFEKGKIIKYNMQIIMTTAKANVDELLVCIKEKSQKIKQAEAEAEKSKILQELKEKNEKLIREREARQKEHNASMQEMHRKMEEITAAQTRNNEIFQKYIQSFRDQRERYWENRCRICNQIH